MDDSTKKILIITTGVVSLGAIVAITFVILRPASLFKELRCSNGTIVRVINDPGQLLIKYTGVAAVFSVEVEEKLKHSFQIGDNLIQAATESAQILDQKLKEVIVVSSLKDPCTPGFEAITKKIENAVQVKENLNRLVSNISEQVEGAPSVQSNVPLIAKDLEQIQKIANEVTRDLTNP